ncbi:sporozoite antigen [Cryptosporidium ubiquitum]|uniref:Profilin n=1 Tax=Cryptosporidium ubiquitum TaxID=857276 RepID=A0A1J4MCT3_9CRYT|nr:sporozoite antigen [Cryptosporidium ubiquitum]OII70820.1 sporozoite antigen [Cryptosporidium ubiquitum]
MSEWDDMVKEWLIDTGNVCAGGLCSSDGAFYAASADQGDAWQTLVRDDHEENVIQPDGVSVAAEVINDQSTIFQAISEGKAPNGVWLGGNKYKIIRVEKDFQQNDATLDVIFCNKSQGGCFLVNTKNGNVVVAVYDECKDQSSGNCKKVALDLAEYLASQGY